MRLTLRTMLAYMDNVLEPNEAEELGRKIHESEFAVGLLQRIRTVSNKVRMDAPKLDGKGMGNDANTVAEYLDSALPQDRVGDFERVCLESHKHLAEVAGCHQILTIVLGKPADVSESLRDRVYALGHADKVPTVSKPAAGTGAAQAAKSGSNGHPAVAARTDAQVPDYLRAGRRTNFWQLLGTAAAVFLVTALVLRLMGPFDGTHPVLKLFGDQGAPDAGVVAVNKPNGEAEPPISENSASRSPTEAAVAADQAAADSAAQDSSAAKSSAKALDVEPGAPVLPPVPPISSEPAAGPATSDKLTTDEPATDKPATKVASLPEAPESPEATVTPPAGEPRPKPLPAAPEADVLAPEPVAEAMDVGRFLSDEQVLAHEPKSDGLWMRLSPRAVLAAGERMVSLPAFRPQIALASGVQVTMAGESSIRLGKPNETGAATMAVDYGRMLLVTVGAAGAEVELDLAGVRGVATLVDADSALAVSVKRLLPPGVDPEAYPSTVVVELFNTFGRVNWQEAEKEPVEIPTNFVRIYVGADPPDDFGPYVAPEWIDAKSVPPIDRESQVVLERFLASDRPLNLSLAEMLQDRRVNVRSLAARCLAALGEYEPIVSEFSDPRQYSFWVGEFQLLRQIVQRSPERAIRLRNTIERLRPDQADELYRLLWGYSTDQLAKEGAATLVKQLESEHMDVRVLAIQNLMSITGAMEFYRPEKKPEESRAAIQAWKSRLAKNRITYTTPPSAIEPYKPLDKPPPAASDLSAPRGAVGPSDGLRTSTKWYQGGTLHKATMKEWSAATPENKLATAADMLMVLYKQDGIDLETVDIDEELRPAAAGLVKGLDAANKDGVADHQPVAQIASMVHALMKADSKE